MKTPHHQNHPNTIRTPSTHIFLVQRRTHSRLSYQVPTQQTLACYTSSKAALQHVQAAIKKLQIVKVDVNVDVDAKLNLRSGDDDGRFDFKEIRREECYIEVAAWNDPEVGKKKGALGVLRVELKCAFHGEDGDESGVGLDVGSDLELAEDCIGQVEVGIELDMGLVMDVDFDVGVGMDFCVDDDTLVGGNVDKILDWVEYLPAVDSFGKGLQARGEGVWNGDVDGDVRGGGRGGGGDEDVREGDGGGGGEQEKETYVRDFYSMIERLHVHDALGGQSLDPVVCPQDRRLSQMQMTVEGTSTREVQALRTSPTKSTRLQITDCSAIIPSSTLVSKKRNRANEEGDVYEDGEKGHGDRMGASAIKRLRVMGVRSTRPA